MFLWTQSRAVPVTPPPLPTSSQVGELDDTVICDNGSGERVICLQETAPHVRNNTGNETCNAADPRGAADCPLCAMPFPCDQMTRHTDAGSASSSRPGNHSEPRCHR